MTSQTPGSSTDIMNTADRCLPAVRRDMMSSMSTTPWRATLAMQSSAAYTLS